MTENKQTLQELLNIITQNNFLARRKDGAMRETAHQACKSAIEEIIRRDCGVVSNTFEEMFNAGTGIDCKACVDAFRYAHAQIYNDTNTIEEIEKKYCTSAKGSTNCPSY
ncbi:MAG: hypothetical protein NTY99_01095 [DPANN group archaeon]|nr:hypothetical protein [DPANN group archaeon]